MGFTQAAIEKAPAGLSAGELGTESWPLTPNGKLDRKALSCIASNHVSSAPASAPAANEVEQKIAQLWGDLLNLDNVGRDNNFFDLGGHSLLATQVISRVRSTFRVQLPLRSLFDSPTVAGLADEIARIPQTSEDEDVAKLLRELEGLSDEEAERLLANELQNGTDSSDSGNR